MPLALAIILARLKASTPTSRSVVDVSQLGLMSGLSIVSAETIVTLPRERGATRATPKVAYWPGAVIEPDKSPANARYSISGQSAGNWERSERAEDERLARDEAGSFSHPILIR